MKATHSDNDPYISTIQSISLGRHPLSPLRKVSASARSDVDFSPSTRRYSIQVSQHPVPSSLDNGLTLDWCSCTIEEEKNDRKWSLSSRRKEKMPPLELMQDQQEKNHQGACYICPKLYYTLTPTRTAL